MKDTILFILHLPPPIHGAATMGKYIEESKLINSNFDCHYINLTTAKSIVDIGKFRLNKFVSYIKLLNNIRNKIKQCKPSLVYITPNAKGTPFYKDFIVVQMVKLMGCNTIIHYHNKGVEQYQNRIIDNLLYKLFFKNLKVIILAETLYNDIKKYVKKNSTFICQNGISENKGLIIDEKRNNKVVQLLFLSNLLESKGVIVLLDACKLLKDKGYIFKCIFVGGESKSINSERFNYELKIRNLENFVEYHGKKFGSDKDLYFRNSDIFIFPTYYETFGLVNIEAMEYKLPVISTNEGGIPDIVIDGETGFIVEKKNPIHLAEKIEILLKDEKLRNTMGLNGYNRFKSKFTIQHFENNLCEIFNSCINQYN